MKNQKDSTLIERLPAGTCQTNITPQFSSGRAGEGKTALPVPQHTRMPRRSPSTAQDGPPPDTQGPALSDTARQFHGPEREGFGGEKAARGDASLPVPPVSQSPRQSNTPAQVCTGSAPGAGERKCEGVFPQKSGKTPRISAALTPSGPRLPLSSAKPTTRTWHRHPAGRRGCGGRRTRPPLTALNMGVSRR